MFASAISDATRLFDDDGQRKYLCDSESRRFHDAARETDPATRAFARLLAYAGCRISEALAVTPRQLDPESGRVIFRTLKRRRRVFRAVPIPELLMVELQALAQGLDTDARLWSWSRQTAWRRIKRIMAEAGIAGPQATPKGLRHQFGVVAAARNVPSGTAQRWMGHASPETTAIYQHAVGDEERSFARRMWQQDEDIA